MDFSIRAANLDDCKDIMRMIMELAEYDKLTDHVKITQKDLEQDGFSKNPFFHVIIAEVPEQLRSKEGHTKVGYALYFYSYSSWKGRSIYMLDLYVMPEFRGKGVGKALMSKVAQVSKTAGPGCRLPPAQLHCCRLEQTIYGLLPQPGLLRCHHEPGLPLHAL